MNAKLWVCVIVGVLVAHLSVLFIWDHFRSLGRPLPKPPEEPSFIASTTIFTNERGEKVRETYEFTVRTEMADPKTLEKLPAPPKPGAELQAGAAAPAAAN